jgi:hypothetical protein
MSLMEFLEGLLSDAGMREHFLADPRGTLTDQGLAHLSPADVHDALVLVEDTRTADFGYGTAADPGPLAPPPGDHADAVQYLNSYLSGEQPDHGGTGDIDLDFDPDPDLAPFADGHDDTTSVDTTSFGAGDTAGHTVEPGADVLFGAAVPPAGAYEGLVERETAYDAGLDTSAGYGDGDGGPGPDADPHDEVEGHPADPPHDIHF